MAIHDYIIDDQIGINFLADLNTVLSAIVSNNSNATEPTITERYAYMWWSDTNDGILKQRNSSNTGWVDILDLTTGGSVSTAINDLTDAIADALNNLALGENALINNTIGEENTALGKDALQSNTEGNENTAIGVVALASNTLGAYNTAIGRGALTANTTGNENTAIGWGAFRDNITGTQNTALGLGALRHNTEGNENTAIGVVALASNTVGDNNTALGRGALASNTTGSGNVSIGFGSENENVDDDFSINLGYVVRGIGSNYLTFGKGFGSDRVWNQFTTNATWTRVSDERIKKDIETNEDCGLSFINELRTVTYKFKAPSELSPEMSEFDENNDIPSHDKPMYGFIAQEVKRALDKHGIKNFAGHHQIKDGKDNLQGISYEMFVMPLVKAVQELSTKNQELEARIDARDIIINDLIKRVESLEAK
jgi:hypothetical protein